jgi:hypothetical protein
MLKLHGRDSALRFPRPWSAGGRNGANPDVRCFLPPRRSNGFRNKKLPELRVVVKMRAFASGSLRFRPADMQPLQEGEQSTPVGFPHPVKSFVQRGMG